MNKIKLAIIVITIITTLPYILWYIAVPAILGVCVLLLLTGRFDKVLDILFNSEEE